MSDLTEPSKVTGVGARDARSGFCCKSCMAMRSLKRMVLGASGGVMGLEGRSCMLALLCVAVLLEGSTGTLHDSLVDGRSATRGGGLTDGWLLSVQWACVQ